jgi:hypothetical protein
MRLSGLIDKLHTLCNVYTVDSIVLRRARYTAVNWIMTITYDIDCLMGNPYQPHDFEHPRDWAKD